MLLSLSCRPLNSFCSALATNGVEPTTASPTSGKGKGKMVQDTVMAEDDEDDEDEEEEEEDEDEEMAEVSLGRSMRRVFPPPTPIYALYYDDH